VLRSKVRSVNVIDVHSLLTYLSSLGTVFEVAMLSVCLRFQ